MTISLTEAAADRVRNYLNSRPSAIGLRIGVQTTGCNGYAYVVDYAEDSSTEDIIFEHLGIKIFVDSESLQLIDGTRVDFVKDGLNESFKFNNPNIAGECGCGESFNI